MDALAQTPALGTIDGKIKDLAAHSVMVGAECIQIVEDVHMAIEHTVCMSLTRRFQEISAA